MNLSLEGIGSYSPPSSEERHDGSERLQKTGANPQRRVHAGAGVLRRTPAVSPGSAEEEDMMSVYVPQVMRVLSLSFRAHAFTEEDTSEPSVYVFFLSSDLCRLLDNFTPLSLFKPLFSLF